MAGRVSTQFPFSYPTIKIYTQVGWALIGLCSLRAKITRSRCAVDPHKAVSSIVSSHNCCLWSLVAPSLITSSSLTSLYAHFTGDYLRAVSSRRAPNKGMN
ncbi:hypothetical protein LguiA_009644 [Lonicera macranthoides]